MMSAVAERSGRRISGGSSRVTTTSKSIAALWPPTCWDSGGRIALCPIFVTRPRKMRRGKASISTTALSRRVISGTSVSSTSMTASTTERSLIVRRRLPGLFMVPTIAVSPSSMFRRVTRPAMGARITVLASWSSASARAARAWSTPWRAAVSCASDTSRVVRASSSCWRLTRVESRVQSVRTRSKSLRARRRLASSRAT